MIASAINNAQSAGAQAEIIGGTAPEAPRLDASCVIKNKAIAASAPAVINCDVPPSLGSRKHTKAPINDIAVNSTGRTVSP